jgi:hypothetical protein
MLRGDSIVKYLQKGEFFYVNGRKAFEFEFAKIIVKDF